MGERPQKRIIRKLELELFLSKIVTQPAPQAHLEQYTVSPSVASTMLYIGAYANNDVIGKTVLDLGCGTGRLALGASYLGAKEVVGVDIDRRAIKTAVENSRKVGLAGGVQWVIGGIQSIVGRFDTVLQNPPFGVQTREADRVFLVKALELGCSVYSLHNHPETDKQLIKQLRASSGFLQVPPSPFLERFVTKHNGEVKAVYSMLMTIPRIFDFHEKPRHDFVVDLYVIKGSS
ncbi:MAG TPA: METTL5 family protein [Candidatus Limnocylindrales bacterium]|nr:METTL5 family protein [Candidatus Limnocylindrales bacterium]